MGIDDLILKKTAKKYLKNFLQKILKEAKPKELTTPEKIAEYLAEKAETIFEDNFL